MDFYVVRECVSFVVVVCSTHASPTLPVNRKSQSLIGHVCRIAKAKEKNKYIKICTYIYCQCNNEQQ